MIRPNVKPHTADIPRKALTKKVSLDNFSDEQIRDILTYMANVSIYGLVNPDKVNPEQLHSIGVMFTEATISILNAHPELAREVLKDMPGHLQTATYECGNTKETDLEYMPLYPNLPAIEHLKDAIKDTDDEIKQEVSVTPEFER